MEIIKIPHPVLDKNTRNLTVDEIKSGSIKELMLEMKNAMVDHGGVGLAANQIGKDVSIFVIDKKLAEQNNVSDVFINPEITEYSRDTDETEEGCLSIIDYWVPIKRSKKIKIKFVDDNGKKHR